MTTTTRPAEDLRQAALDYLWMHHRDWLEMAEEGGPMIISDSKGVKVTDIEGRSWIDVNGGYASVNAGFGQTEIAEAARDQMLKLPYFPEGATTEPAIRLAARLAVQRRLRGYRDGHQDGPRLPQAERGAGAVQDR